ncbi:hypothetical protein [Streptococcus oricebi]|uniref:ABC transporter permease n=1 Tax=Streptococcus oricebi TaxID=1547447 RepID=A0ABS5B2P3_9STRE|nr:hypothetical protein [Streptococcus oricebi]MBP2623077.1 hypothetical protein [Streptococcus oricebi]
MFGKLLKHELKASYKIYLILFIILGGFSLLTGLLGMIFNRSDNNTTLLLLLLIFLMIGFMAIALLVTNLMVCIRRFYRTVFGAEAYLTWTLPVNPHQVILSKLTSSMIWYSLSLFGLIFASLAIFLLASPNNLSYALHTLKAISSWSGFTLLLSHLISMLANFLYLYLVICLGQLAQKHRLALSYAAFFGLWAAITILESLFLIKAESPFAYYHYFYPILRLLDPSYHAPDELLLFVCIYDFIKIGLFYSGSYLITKNKLNLQ